MKASGNFRSGMSCIWFAACDRKGGELKVALFDGLNARIKRFTVYDLKLLQGAAIFVGLVVVKLLEPVLNIYELNIGWFILAAAILGIKPVYIVLSGK